MTVQELATLLAHVSYKPGWRFQLSDSQLLGSAMILITAEVPDAEGERARIQININFFVSLNLDPAGVLTEVRRYVLKMEEHEVDEFLRVDGRHLVDPHPEPVSTATSMLDVKKALAGYDDMLDVKKY